MWCSKGGETPPAPFSPPTPVWSPRAVAVRYLHLQPSSRASWKDAWWAAARSPLFKSSPSCSVKVSTKTLHKNTIWSKIVTSDHPFTPRHPYPGAAFPKCPPQYAAQVTLIPTSLREVCRHFVPSWAKGRASPCIAFLPALSWSGCVKQRSLQTLQHEPEL